MSSLLPYISNNPGDVTTKLRRKQYNCSLKGDHNQTDWRRGRGKHIPAFLLLTTWFHYWRNTAFVSRLMLYAMVFPVVTCILLPTSPAETLGVVRRLRMRLFSHFNCRHFLSSGISGCMEWRGWRERTRGPGGDFPVKGFWTCFWVRFAVNFISQHNSLDTS